MVKKSGNKQLTFPGLEPLPPLLTFTPAAPDRMQMMYRYHGRGDPGRFCFSCHHFRPPIVRAETDQAYGRCDAAIIKAIPTEPWESTWPGCGLHQTHLERGTPPDELADYKRRGVILTRESQRTTR